MDGVVALGNAAGPRAGERAWEFGSESRDHVAMTEYVAKWLAIATHVLTSSSSGGLKRIPKASG